MPTALRGCFGSCRWIVLPVTVCLLVLLSPLPAPAEKTGAEAPVPGGTPPPPYPGYGCAAPIDDLLAGSAVDVGRRDFDLRRLGAGFELETFGVRAEGECDEQGDVVDPDLAVSTSWRHAAGGERLHVTQRTAAEPVANLFEHGWASFWWQGYAFDVTFAGGVPGPVDPPGGMPAPRALGPATPRFHVAAAVGEELLAEAIAALAPGLDHACFHRRVEGGWSALVGLDLGDPRPAVPAGYTEASLALTFLEHPAASCGGPAPAGGDGVNFSAAFHDPAGSWIGIWAFSRPDSGPGSAGYLDDYSASWSGDRYTYAVSLSSVDGAGDPELVRALATALDPEFDVACLAQWRTLTPQEAVALGFHLAEPPAGFTETSSQLSSYGAAPECADPAPASYTLSWSFSDGADLVIDAAASRTGGGMPGGVPAPPPGHGGTGAPGGGGVANPEPTAALSWMDAGGTSYWVFGYSISGSEPPALALLEAVARSMDPTYGSAG